MRSATKRKIGKDPAYLDFIRTLPCCVCVHMAAQGLSHVIPQRSPTESAHVGPRGLSQKCPDRETLPLCAEHHRLSQFSQHAMGKRFWSHYDLNLDALLAMYQAKYCGYFDMGESVLDAREVCA